MIKIEKKDNGTYQIVLQDVSKQLCDTFPEVVMILLEHHEKGNI